jgi:hypothetical protein
MAKPLTYIDQRDAITRLNDVLGPENWGCVYDSDGARLTCTLLLKASDTDVIEKSNGAGDTDIEGTKGGYSDAFKRAAVLAGVGLYLYDCDLPWKPIENGKYFSERTVEELRDLMEEKNAELSTGSVTPIRELRPVPSAANSTPVPPPTVKQSRERIIQIAKDLDSIIDEEALLTIIHENLDVFGKLHDRDKAKAGIKGNVNWYLTNGPDGDTVSIRDRIVNKAASLGKETLLNVTAVLEEHRL